MATSQLIPATAAHLEVLRNLMQLYLYDFSEMLCGEPEGHVDERGLFDPGCEMSRYVEQAGYNAYLLRVDDHPAGFALISDRADKSPDGRGRNIDEFFVMRCYRRQGVGRWMAAQLFDSYRGFWQVAQIGPNRAAQAFWRKVIGRYSGGRYREFTVQERGFTIVWQVFDSSTW